jgi:hypothetical protein
VLVHRCGVKKGDRVAISMRNYPEWIFAFTAVLSIGAVAVAMNAHWQAEDMAYALAGQRRRRAAGRRRTAGPLGARPAGRARAAGAGVRRRAAARRVRCPCRT